MKIGENILVKKVFPVYVEDTGSGYSFVNHFFSNIFKGNVVVYNPTFFKGISEGGIGNLLSLVESGRITFGIILYDGCANSCSAAHRINKLLNITRKNAYLHCVDIRCFEFMMLSITILDSWLMYNEIKKEQYSYYKTTLLCKQNINYYVHHNFQEFQKYFPKANINNFKNDETLYYYILREITQSTPFRITKNQISPCWLKDCCIQKFRKENFCVFMPLCQNSKTVSLDLKYTLILRNSEWYNVYLIICYYMGL